MAKHCLEEHSMLMCPFCDSITTLVFGSLEAYLNHITYFHQITQARVAAESAAEALEEVLQMTCAKVPDNGGPVCHLCLFSR